MRYALACIFMRPGTPASDGASKGTLVGVGQGATHIGPGVPAAPNIHAWIMHRAILTYLSSLTVTQGPKRGEPFEVLPWERMFIRGAFAVDDDVALSMGRGGGKTTFVAALACAIRDPDGPLHEKAEATDAVIAASSFGQGLRPFRAVQRFLAAKGYDLHDRKVWRMHDYHAMNASVSRIA